ncbi:hypothetical protein SCANM63S_06247 [Streptomyces canarius]
MVVSTGALACGRHLRRARAPRSRTGLRGRPVTLVRRARRGRCDRGVGSLVDRSVHQAEPAAVQQADHRACGVKADSVREDRAWSLPLGDRVLLVPRTGGPTSPRAGSPRCSVPKSAADRIVDHLGPALGLQPRRRYRKSTVLIVDGTLVPARDRTVTASSEQVILHVKDHLRDVGRVVGTCRSRPWIVSDELWSSLSRCCPSRGRSWSGARPRAPDQRTSCGVPFVLHGGRPAPETGIRFEDDPLAPPGRVTASRRGCEAVPALSTGHGRAAVTTFMSTDGASSSRSR